MPRPLPAAVRAPFAALTRASLAWPRAALLAAAALTLAALPGLARLELRTDGHALVPADEPAVAVDAEVRERFGLRDPIVVLLETDHPEGIYNPETLDRLQRLSDALGALDGVGPGQVTSLATERRDRVYPGTLTFRPFLDPPPDTPELLETLRGDVAAASLLRGTLVSNDGTAAAVLVGAPPGSTGDRTGLYRRIDALARSLEGGGDRLFVAGAPVAEALLGSHLLEDLSLLLPASLLVIGLAVWIGCRRAWCVALALANVGACILWTFGLMGWLGVPVYLTTAVLPVVLTTVGLADEIHLLWHHQRRIAAGEGDAAGSVGRLLRPMLLTSVTTAAGFLSFLASPLAAVRAFGAFAALGVALCLLWVLGVTPAALALLGPERFRRPAPARRRLPAFDPARLFARPGRTLVVLGVVTVLLGAGAARLVVQDSWIDGFAPGSPFRQATDRIDHHLHGTHLLLAELAFDLPPQEREAAWGAEKPYASPRVLREIGAFEDYLRRQPGVGGVLGPHSHLTAVTYLWLGRREDARQVPESAQRVELAWNRFEMGRGEHRRREVVDDELGRGVVTIFLEDANYRDTAALMEDVRAWADRRLAPLGGRLRFAGDVAVSQAMIPAIVRTQVSSLLLALGGALLAVLLATRSPRAALLAVLPVSLAVLWIFGGMGWAGVPLGVATSMFCAIALGIGIDYAIHFLDRLGGRRGPEAVGEAASEVGPAIVTDAAAIAFGFGLLTLSQVPANARLGGLVAFALLASCVLTLAGLGALLARKG